MQVSVSESRLIRFAGVCLEAFQKVLPAYSSRYSKKDFTQHQLAVLVCLMRKYKPKYRDFAELLEVMTELREFLGLQKVPHWTTLNKFFLRMKNFVLSTLLGLSAGESSGKGSVDATCFDRRHASRHYTKRAKLRIKSLKTTLLVDTETQKVLDVHSTTTRKHDSKIVLPLVNKTRERHRLNSLRGDAGYDDREVRKRLRAQGIRPLIKHREFKPLQKAWNVRMDKAEYSQRSKSETVNSAVKRKYGDHVSSKEWFTQFKEVKLAALVYNLDLEVKKVFGVLLGFLQSFFRMSI